MSAIDWIAMSSLTRVGCHCLHVLMCGMHHCLVPKWKFLGQYYYLFKPNGNKESSLLLYKFLLLDKERLVRGSCQLPPTSFIFRN